MKECGFAWNFGPYLSWPPFNCHHFQQWNHCKACAWLHTEDNLIVSCCENGDQAVVWVSRVERWVQPDLLPALPESLLITWAPWCFCLLNRNRCYAENLLKMLLKIEWTLFYVDRVILWEGRGLVNNRVLLRTVGWFYDNMGVVQVANIRTRPLDSADHSLINLLLPGGSFKTWTKK